MNSIKDEIENLQLKIYQKEDENRKLVEKSEVRKYIERKCLLDYFSIKNSKIKNNVINSDLINLMIEVDNLCLLKNVKRYISNKNTLKFYNDVQKILLRQYKINNCEHVWYVMGENKQDKICRCLLCEEQMKQNKVIYNGQIEGKNFDETKKEYSNYLKKYHQFKTECINDEIVKKLIIKKRK